MVVNRLIRPHNKHHGGLPMAKCSMSRHNSGVTILIVAILIATILFVTILIATILSVTILIVAIAEQFSSSQFCSLQ